MKILTSGSRQRPRPSITRMLRITLLKDPSCLTWWRTIAENKSDTTVLTFTCGYPGRPCSNYLFKQENLRGKAYPGRSRSFNHRFLCDRASVNSSDFSAVVTSIFRIAIIRDYPLSALRYRYQKLVRPSRARINIRCMSLVIACHRYVHRHFSH